MFEPIHRVLDLDPCPNLDAYISSGGRIALDAAREIDPQVILETIADSGLRGRGGAGFPTAKKWLAVMGHNSDTSPTAVLVNGAEGEPSTLKDRFILRNNPYRVIEGALIACEVVGADELVVCVKASFAGELTRLRAVLAEVEAAGWARNIKVRIVAGPDSYLFGEETGLLEVASNRQPFPRVTPPWRRGLSEGDGVEAPASLVDLATTTGDSGAPALVNNVETLANVALIVRHGAAWFREVGTADSPGSIVCTITGDVQRHGVAEFPMGTPLSEVISQIGVGPLDGRRLVAVLPGASSAIIHETNLGVPCTHEDFAKIGSGLGSGGFLCLDDSADLRIIAAGASRFLAVESCGQCTACKRDGIAVASLLATTVEPAGDVDLIATDSLISERLMTITDGARCSLASQQRTVVGSILAYPVLPSASAADAIDRSAELALLMTPLVDILDGAASYDERHLTKNYDWSQDVVDSGQFPAQRLQDVPSCSAPDHIDASVDGVETRTYA